MQLNNCEPKYTVYLQPNTYIGRLINNVHSEIFCQRSIVAMRAQCVLVATTLLHSGAKFIPLSTPVLKQCVLKWCHAMVVCQRD